MKKNREDIEKKIDEGVKATLAKVRAPIDKEIANLKTRLEQAQAELLFPARAGVDATGRDDARDPVRRRPQKLRHLVVRPMAEWDKAASCLREPRADSSDLRDHVTLLGCRVLEIASDDCEVEALEQTGIARPGLDERRDALHPVEPGDREEQRKPAPLSGQRGDRRGEGAGRRPAGVDGVPCGGVDGDPLGDRAEAIGVDCGEGRPEQLPKLALEARSGKHGERGGLAHHPIEEPRAEDVLVLEIGRGKRGAVEVPGRLGVAEHRVAVRPRTPAR